MLLFIQKYTPGSIVYFVLFQVSNRVTLPYWLEWRYPFHAINEGIKRSMILSVDDIPMYQLMIFPCENLFFELDSSAISIEMISETGYTRWPHWLEYPSTVESLHKVIFVGKLNAFYWMFVYLLRSIIWMVKSFKCQILFCEISIFIIVF